jgi:predicted phage tail protein
MSDDALTPYIAEPEIIDRQAAGSVRVLTLPSPFSFAREEQSVPEGRTLAEILASLELENWKDALVAIDGRPVKQEWWATTRPKPGHLVCIRCIPRGGGGGSDKSWISIAAGVILIVVGILLLGTWAAPASPYLITLGVGLVVSGALQLIFPPPALPRLKSGSGAENPVFSITGSRNVANPYGAICRVYGRHKIFPSERSHS